MSKDWKAGTFSCMHDVSNCKFLNQQQSCICGPICLSVCLSLCLKLLAFKPAIRRSVCMYSARSLDPCYIAVSETFEWNPVKSNSGKILHTILPEIEKTKLKKNGIRLHGHTVWWVCYVVLTVVCTLRKTADQLIFHFKSSIKKF